MAFWWAPCVFPSKMVGSWWAPCVFPSKMGSARMKFKWFFCRDIWVSHCYILGQPGRSQIQCHLPCTKILTQSGTSTVLHSSLWVLLGFCQNCVKTCTCITHPSEYFACAPGNSLACAPRFSWVKQEDAVMSSRMKTNNISNRCTYK